MSQIIPWTDAGGTPCCCISCPRVGDLPANWREIEISAVEFAQIYAGGTIVTEQSLSGSASSSIDATRSISMSGSLSISYQHVLVGTQFYFDTIRQQGCDIRQGESQTLYANPSISSSYTVRPTDVIDEVFESWSYETFFSTPFPIGENTQLAVYDLSSGNSTYGLYIRRQFRANAISGVRSLLNFGTMAAGFFGLAQTATPSDSAVFDLVLPTRTVQVPIQITGTATFSQHRVTYSPSAP